MKKFILLLISFPFLYFSAYSQCTVDIVFNAGNTIDCGDSLTATVSGFADFALDNDFNGGVPGTDWTASSSAQFNNPYDPSLTNDTYLWMGPNADVPRELTSLPLNLAYGGVICFDLVYAVQGNGSPVEGPDLAEEGVSLQYSIDGGLTFIDIAYFCPNDQAGPNNDGIMVSNPGAGSGIGSANGATTFTAWQTYCFPIPPGAQTAGTIIQWSQIFSSTANFDHWGLDNIQIQVADPSYTFYNQNTGSSIDTNYTVIYPTSSDSLDIFYTNGIDDTCYASVPYFVNPTDVMEDFYICKGANTGDTLRLTGVAPWASVLWTPATGLDDPTSHTPFANPPGPNPTTTYTATSACGTDSVDVTFYSVQAVAESDSTCPGEGNQLFANISGASTACLEDYTVFEIPYYKEFGTDTALVFSQADNGTSQILDLPFPFTFYCDPVTQIRPASNGYINMSSANFSLANNQSMGVNIFPNNLVALMWDDLIDSTGNSSYFVSGTAPNRKFVVNFDLVHVGGTIADEQVLGQIILHESTNFVDVICENCQNDASDPTASQGVENPTGFIGTNTPGRGNTNWEGIRSAYRFMPNTPSANSQIIVWTPNYNLYGDSTKAPIAAPDTSTMYTVTVTNVWDNCTYSDSVSFTVADILQVDASGDKSICLGESYTIPAVSNGDTYIWYPNDATLDDNTLLNPTATPDSTQTYVIEAYINGCVHTDTMVLAVSNFVIDSTTLVDEICVVNSGSITIHASGQITGLQYSIDNGATYQTSNVFNNLTGGTYDVLIGSTNCDTSYTVVLDSAAAPIIPDSIVITDANCGNLGAIELFISGGQNPLQYSIDNGTTLTGDTIYPNLIGGSYDIVVQDAQGCIFDSTVVLNSTTPVDLQVDSTILASCSGSMDGSVILEITGGAAPYSYSLDAITYQASNYFSPLDTGVYTAYTEDANGCTDSVSFSINEPTILDVQIDIPGNVLCAGGTIDSLTTIVTGGTPAYSYLWNTTETGNTIQNIVFGTYWVKVTDNNNCVAIDSVIISQPVPLFLEILSDSVICGGQASGLAYIDSISGGVLPYNYSWAGPGGIVPGTDSAENVIAGQYILTVEDFNGCPIMDTTVIFEPTPLIITLDADTLSCYGDNDACIDATISGGTPPYSYSWSNGIVTQDQCGLTAGWYTISVTDARNCVYVDSVEVLQPDSISLNGSQINVTCYGLNNGSATVVATGGTTPYNYAWSGLTQTTATASNLTAGVYTATITDVNGCIDSIAYTITQPTDSITLTVDSITDVLCNGSSTGSIYVSVIGGTAPYTYAWTNGGGSNEDLQNASAGVYTVTVSDANNCPMSIADTITEPSAIAITLTATNATCFAASTGSVDATISGGTAPYTYSWTGANGYSATTEDIDSIPAGTFSITVTDANNCTATQNSTVTQPAVVLTSFTTTPVNCFGGNDGTLTVSVTTGGTAPFTYQWDAAASNQTSATASGLSEGAYEVEITDVNGCVYSFDDNVSQPLAPLSIVLDSSNVTCASLEDGTTSVVASGGTTSYTYLWNDPQGQTTAQTTNLGPGTFQVTVTDANGCVEVASIQVTAPPALTLSVITDSTNCFGQSTGAISITAGGGTQIGYAYSIDGGETFQNSPDFFNLTGGIYDQILIQDLGSNVECYSNPISATVFEQPFFSFEVIPGDTTLQLEESLQLDLNITSPNYSNADIAQISWYPTTGLNCSDCIDPTVLTYDHYTEYTATVYYEGGDQELCNYNASTIIVVENNLFLFIPNAFTPDGFDDVNNVFEIYSEGVEYMTMQIYNRWGEKIFESSNQRVTWDGTFKGELQAPGVYSYYVDVEYLDGKSVQRKGSVSLIR